MKNKDEMKKFFDRIVIFYKKNEKEKCVRYICQITGLSEKDSTDLFESIVSNFSYMEFLDMLNKNLFIWDAVKKSVEK